ncbi:phage tail length tape measure family protein [Variovorax sp. VaC1]|uniref:phage tail length tape measure family protein n=1 Tax=Variovorax sp. VaC1 TaxID=3373132 RepID=UPI0037482195
MADDQKNAPLPTVDLADMLKGAPKALEGAKNVKGLIDGLASFGGGAEGGGGKKLNLAKAGLDALAYFGDANLKGRREVVGYKNATLESGNPFGYTTNELGDYAFQMSRKGGTQAQASEVVAALVASGKVGPGALLEVGAATMALNRVTGVPIEKSVEQFKSLRDAPTKKSIEFNKEGKPYLSLQELQTMGKLEKQGDVEAAGALAQIAFARKQNQRTQELAANRILPDRALTFAMDKVDRLDDAVRGTGRDTSLQREIDRTAKLYERRLEMEARGRSRSGLPMDLVSREGSAEELRQKLETLKESQRQDRKAALLTAENTVKVRKGTAAYGEVWEAGDGGKKADNPSAGTRTDAGTKRAVTRGTARAQASVSSGIQHAQGDGLQSCIVMACGCKAGTSEQKNQSGLKDQANKASQSQAAESEQAKSASARQDEAQQAGLLEAMRRSTSSVREQATALEAQNAVYGLSKDAVQALNIAQLERQINDLEATEQVIPGYVEALRERVKAERELRTATQGSEDLKTKDEKQKKEKKKDEDEEEKKTKKMADDIGGVFKEGFVNLIEGGGNDAVDKIGKGLKKKLTQSLADAFYDATLKDAVDGFAGWLTGALKGSISGGGSKSGGGSSGLGGIFGAVSSLFGGFSGSTAAGLANIVGGSDPLGSMIGFMGLASAKGNVFASPGLHAYANSVVGSPTFFPFANGIGLMGEAGPEAIMPLRRGSDGRLGVSAPAGGGGGGSGSLHYAPTNVFNIDSRSDRGAVLADLDRALQANNKGQMEQLKRLRVVPQ